MSQFYDETREEWGVIKVTSFFPIKHNVSSPQKHASSNLYETSPFEINQTFIAVFI